jgi:hypothetical protein
MVSQMPQMTSLLLRSAGQSPGEQNLQMLGTVHHGETLDIHAWAHLISAANLKISQDHVTL